MTGVTTNTTSGSTEVLLDQKYGRLIGVPSARPPTNISGFVRPHTKEKVARVALNTQLNIMNTGHGIEPTGMNTWLEAATNTNKTTEIDS